MHQIIETFEDPDRKEDMTYAYLMVFGLFFGNFAGSQSTLPFERLIATKLKHRVFSTYRSLKQFLSVSLQLGHREHGCPRY